MKDKFTGKEISTNMLHAHQLKTFFLLNQHNEVKLLRQLFVKFQR
jgi:hypothetical protein